MQQATEDWEYVDDYGRWMNVEGKVVRLKDLSSEEMLAAVHALVAANFKRRGSNTNWTMALSPGGKFDYPKHLMNVGQKEALAKLEEMQGLLTERGLLGIRT